MSDSPSSPSSGATPPADSEEGGALYWFFRHSWEWFRGFFAFRARTLRLLGLLLLLFLLFFRASYQWLVLEIRNLLLPILLGVAALWLLRALWRREARWAKALLVSLVVFLIVAAVAGNTIYHYLWLYHRYSLVNPVALAELPETDHERIQPESSIFALAHDAVTETESPRPPDFIRVGDAFRWVMAIEPSYPLQRLMMGVRQLLIVPGDESAPRFGADNRVPVKFETGDNLLLGRNAKTATVRTFGLWRYLNYEPAEVYYLPDEHGDWVQVVSLIRWRGILFPWPEFGGVQIFRQRDESLLSYLELALLGDGEFIPAEHVADYPFLRGQNLLSRKVSLAIADSFRFEHGFLGPLPGYHEGDVRIPELELDVNPQPFISFFRTAEDSAGSLYHYFALEPFDVEKQGLNTSILVPADGRPEVLVYRHYQHPTTLSGVSSIATKVMESRKDYDWERNRPVEHRPFIRDIGGVRRFFWLTTVVTARLGKEKGRFIAGGIPEIVLTDASYNTSIWVNPREPQSWVDSVRSAMEGSWTQMPAPAEPPR